MLNMAMLIDLLLCARNSARNFTKCSAMTFVSEIKKKYWFVCDFPQYVNVLQYYLRLGFQETEQETKIRIHMNN